MTAEEKKEQEELELYLYLGLGEYLKDKREKLGLTQEQVGKRLKKSGASISHIEAGKQRPSLGLLYRICEVLELEPKEILPTRVELKTMSSKLVPIKLGKARRVSPATLKLLDEFADKLEKKR